MEPEGSLPNSQELSTCPYPEPDQSSLDHPNLSLSPRSILILPIYTRPSSSNSRFKWQKPCSVFADSVAMFDESVLSKGRQL
jgi:hypothetical protein